MIIKFKIFENNIDIDPYGEEDWNDENEIKEGDIVLCIQSKEATGNLPLVKHEIKKGINYEVIDVGHNEIFITVKGVSGWWNKRLFKKVHQ
jgi:hypothetical protein